jgi:glycine cleavage system H protein
MEGDTAVVGITDFAQTSLGDVVYVELPPVGSSFKKDEAFGVVESVKAASDLFMPIGGEVVAVNNDLVDEPSLVNKDPHGVAWMIRVKPSDPAEMDTLMDAASYEAFVASEQGGH